MLNEIKSRFLSGKRILVILVMLIAMNANAQWQPDVRLTIDPANSNTSANNAWCVASKGSYVHIVWYDNRDGNCEIYYKRSTDTGLTWGADTRLTNNNALSWYPSIAVFGNNIHIVWTDERDGNREIYYKRSSDEGLTWGTDMRLTNNPDPSENPSVAVAGSFVYVTWVDKRDIVITNYEIYYKYSSDAGINWSVDTRMTNDVYYSLSPSISVSESVINLIWEDWRDNNSEIYYKRSTDNGMNWSTDTRLTNNSSASNSPCIMSSSLSGGSLLQIVWEDYRDGNYEIYYKRSTDEGLNWNADVRLTNNTAYSERSSIAISGTVVYVVWEDTRDGNWEIYYKRSVDAGLNWEEDTRLTNNSANSVYPFIAVSGSFVHVIWQDNRDGNPEIYYKRNPTGNVGIHNISTETPSKYSLSQNYPNPFNPTTNIKFSIVNTGEVKLVVYDIQGREVQTLVNERLQPGTYEAAFDGSMLNSGIYFYKLIIRHGGSSTNTFSETKKMLMIK